MVTFQVKKEMPLEEWKDHVLGSGAFSWDWWIEVLEFENGLQVTWYDDADNPDSSETVQSELTWQELADKCSEYARESQFVANQLANDDFDADGMDRVLQYAFMGEVIYG